MLSCRATRGCISKPDTIVRNVPRVYQRTVYCKWRHDRGLLPRWRFWYRREVAEPNTLLLLIEIASCWLITFIYLYICFFLKRGAWQTLRCKERKYDKLKRVCGKQLASFLGATNRTSVLQRSKLHLIVYHLFQSHELKLPWDFPWTKMLAAISNY